MTPPLIGKVVPAPGKPSREELAVAGLKGAIAVADSVDLAYLQACKELVERLIYDSALGNLQYWEAAARDLMKKHGRG